MSWLFRGQSNQGELIVARKTAFRAAYVLLMALAFSLSAYADKGHARHGHRNSVSDDAHGGQQPIVGAHVYLFAFKTTGPGSAPISLLHGTGVTTDSSGNGYVTTDANGDFNVAGLYASYCPASTSSIYFQLVDGNPGSGTNTAVNLVTAIPVTCSALSSAPAIMINELTTVAAAWELKPYATVATNSFATSVGNIQELANAISITNNLVSAYSGSASTTTPDSIFSIPTQTINTLGDILAACVNTVASSATCMNLFSAATPPGGTEPTNTLQAAVDIAKNPTQNVNTLYNLVGTQPPWSDTLPSAPASWNVTYGVPSNTQAYKRAITISHANVQSTDQLNFPVLISIPSTTPFLATTANGGEVQSSSGYDIFFTADQAGQQLLDFDVDNYNPSTGAASFWVRIPDLSHTTDTTIYIWYGIANVAYSLENRLGVWSNNYLSVYHLGNGSTVSASDSGIAGYTLSGSAYSSSTGEVGGAAQFNGNTSYNLYHNSVLSYPTGSNPVTLEAWVQQASGNTVSEVIGYGANTGTGSRAGISMGANGTPTSMEFESLGFTGPMPATGWHHIVDVYGGGAIGAASITDGIYVDGAVLPWDVPGAGGTPNITTTQLTIGGIPTVTGSYGFSGLVDEVRISSGTRSAAWIATEYTNQSSPGTFSSMGQQVPNVPAVPSITWNAPSAISYGTALSASQLDATASVPGTFVYSPQSGTVLGVGTQTLSVTFTPTDTIDYTTTTTTTTLMVNQATPGITWSAPAAITYGTALGGFQLNATAAVSGTFAYSPQSGTVLGAGSQILSLTFTPSDTIDYTSATASTTLTVNQGTPTLSWPSPSAINSGTALSESQLDATANVLGTFVYTPQSGTVLGAGSQTLSVTFTPNDTVDYTTVTANTTLTVIQLGLSVSLIPACTPNPVPLNATAQCAVQLPRHLTPEPTGTVSFSVDGVVWSTATVDSDGLAVSSSLSGLSVGAHTVVGTYSGDATYQSGSTDHTLPVLSSSTLPSAVIYSFNIVQSDGVTSGYAPNSNILAYTDSVNGTWGLSYDSLNRLVASTQTPAGSTAVQYGCWSYDSFGNMQQEFVSPQGFASQPGQPCVQTPGAVVVETEMNYANATNQITSGGWKNSFGTFNPPGSPTYDASGNMTNDLQNQYLYDPDGNVCAIQQPSAFGIAGPKIGYLYDADGNRVAKGTLTSMSCDPTTNGFQATNVYIIGPDGQEMTEVDGSGNWVHTNVSASGGMIATYKNDGLGVHFQLADWLGTRRVQTDYLGQIEDQCQSQPFGDGLTCSGPGVDVSKHHFTGKERDTESGLDYFGARYYGSSMGRWMSPDWSKTPTGIPYVDLTNPQTLNLYQYMRNNPLSGVDPDGHCDWCQKVWNKITGNGWKTDAQLGVSTQQGDGYVTPASNADTGGDYGTSTVAVDPTGGMSLTVGGGYGPGSTSLSYTPGTGEVDQTTSLGVAKAPLPGGASISVSNSAPDTGVSVTGSGYFGVGGSVSKNLDTGTTSYSVGLGTPAIGGTVDNTIRLGSVASASVNINVPNIAPQNAACGGGICMESDNFGQWQ